MTNTKKNISFNDASLWLPPPDMKISDWADNNRQISSEASAEPGQWNTDRAPYQREMMDAICDSERVIMMTSAQIGKTEILLNTIGYYVDKEPSPILMLNPTIEMAESFSKDRLAPMVRDTPCLCEKIAPPRVRDSGNTLTHKNFPGGHITMAGANSPASLASRPIRILLCDEVDRYPQSAGTEGDPLSLAMKRTANFWNRKIIWVSTPTIKNASRIEKAFLLSTQEIYEVPCPNCSEYTSYNWGLIEYKNLTEPLMTCPHCGQKFPRVKWLNMQIKGRWRAQNPGAKSRGFNINSFASPWATWTELCDQFEEAQKSGDEAVKVWHNTALGLPYEFNTWSVEINEMDERKEHYDAELPDGVLCLTCGVDTQDNRLELEVVGWGLNYESWGIEYKIIYGSPAGSEVWDELDAYLSRMFSFADGSELGIACTCIDSAGHYTDQVYSFTKPRKSRRIFSIIGRGTFGLPPVSRPSYNNRKKTPLFTVGVSTLKGLLFTRLTAQKNAPGFCHFPENPDKGYSKLYFDGLMSENMKIKRINGQDRVTWEKRDSHIRNEPLDCRIYAMGALSIYNPDMKRLAAVKAKEKAEHDNINTEQTNQKEIKPEIKAQRKLIAPRKKLIVRRGLSLL